MKSRSSVSDYYVAELVITPVANGVCRPLVDTALYLVKAASPEKAVKEAEGIGCCYSLDPYGSGDPEIVFWGVLRLTRMASPPGDGVELRRRVDVYVGFEESDPRRLTHASEQSRPRIDRFEIPTAYFIVDVIRRTKINGAWQPLGEVVTNLISAQTWKKAYRKAVQLGISGERDEIDAAGNRIETVFRAVSQIDPVSEPPGHGSLLRWDFGVGIGADELSEMAANRDRVVALDRA